jgi:hypothetical protein
VTPEQKAALSELADAAKKDLLELATQAEGDAVEAFKSLANDAVAVAAGVVAGSIDADQAKHDLELLKNAAMSYGLAKASDVQRASAAKTMEWLALALKVGVALATA